SAASSIQPRSSVRAISSKDDELRVKRVRSLTEALAVDSQTGRMEALIAYFGKLNSSSFAEEAEKLEGLPMGERMMVSFLLFSQWGETDALAAMDYTSKMGRMGRFMSGSVLKSWASSDPEAAAAYYTSNEDSAINGGRGAAAIATEWAKKDKDAALAWALSQNEQDGSMALIGVFNQIALSDPVEAVSLLGSISDEDSRVSVQKRVALQWGKEDWAATEAWVLSLPADQQSDTMDYALRGLSDADHLAAAEKFTSLANVEGLEGTMEAIARDWSATDPAAASAWVLENGTIAAQKESIGSVVRSWARSNKEEAYEFVTAQGVGEVRDAAASSYINSNFNGDTNENLALAETITDVDSRTRAIGVSVSGWLREDKEAATAYVNESPLLTDSQKESVLKQRASSRFGAGGAMNGRRGRR
ncbi:hypothetical protein OAI07_02370, partial [Akkermansiaceae bacterium]|nr:hypothetical protein [Akkermansiaceae bacterium]